jgi:hypothetical protein
MTRGKDTMSTATLERSPLGERWQGKPTQVVGAGKNTEHFADALQGVREHRQVEVFEMRDVDPELVPYDVLYNLSEEEGRLAGERALGERALAAYISLVPRYHLEAIETHLRRVGKGVLGFVVVAKPAVQTIDEMRQTDAIIAEVEAERRQLLGEEADSLPAALWVHEHYDRKKSWEVGRDALPQLMEVLGRLESASVTIQESQTIESEGRQLAFEGGAIEDLSPHVISIGLGVEEAFNRSERYSSSNKSSLHLERYRYDGTELEENVETGFVISGETTITDHVTGESYELPFKWQGGKGLGETADPDDPRANDRKAVELNFVHPETGKRSTVTIDLQHNTIEAPEEVSHLFPQTKFIDNGYGEVVERGLAGEDPAKSFQDWPTARKVIKLGHFVRRLGKTPPVTYMQDGRSLNDLSREYQAA